MGLLDKFKKGGGGFLNNVDGLIVAGGFTTDIPGGGESKGSFNSLFYRLSVRQDGADGVDETSLFAGSADDFAISDDGQSLEGGSLWGDTVFGRFYASLVANGLEDPDVEDGDPLTFDHIVGVKARFVQVKDEEGMKRAAKTYKASKGKINELGQKKGKDGKFYDQRSLEVSKVYSTGNDVDEPEAPVKGKGGKANPPSKSAKPAAGKSAKKTDENELKEFTQEVVKGVLETAKGNKLAKTGLNVAITRYFQQPDLKNDDRRDAVRKMAYDDAFLQEMAEEGMITYAKSGRDQVLELT